MLLLHHVLLLQLVVHALQQLVQAVHLLRQALLPLLLELLLLVLLLELLQVVELVLSQLPALLLLLHGRNGGIVPVRLSLLHFCS